MSTRRDALLALSLLSVGSATRAQAPKSGRPKRMGYLSLDSEPWRPLEELPFYIALRKKGWILGRNLILEAMYAEGKTENLPRFAEELVRSRRVDIIVCDGNLPALAAARATRTIPIVFTAVIFPVELGLIASYARPGGNVTGLALFASLDFTVKRLSYLREIAPNARRLSYLISAEQGFMETVAGGRFDVLSPFEAATKGLGFEIRYHRWSGLGDLETVLGQVAMWGAEAVTASVGWLGDRRPRSRVVEFLLRHRLPSAFVYRQMVEAGGLLSYGLGETEFAHSQQRMVEYVDQVLRGTSPADLPVEQPRRFELVINMKTAKALGLTVPRSVLAQTDELLQ